LIHLQRDELRGFVFKSKRAVDRTAQVIKNILRNKMQSENKKQFRPKQHFKHRDDRLLDLQKSIISKISKTKDDTLIKFYLHQVHRISQQRLELRKRGAA